MAICQFFVRGNCRFGSKCRNSHDVPGNSVVKTPFTEESLVNDLTPQKDKPLWPLSTFGPAKHEPNLLASLDTSPEELRYQAFIKAELYPAFESQKIAAAEQVYESARNNLNQVYQTALNQCASVVVQTGAVTGNVANAPSSSSSIFGAPAAFTQSAFGTSNTTSAFGASAFSKPPTTTSAFALGASSTSAFAQPSAFGQPAFSNNAQQQTTSAFGQPSPFGQASAFGQATPSSVIKPATGAFGAGGGGAFSAFSGQPSAFGTGAVTSVFGQGTFGAPAPAQPASTFGNPAPATSAFGNPAPVPVASAFGNPNPTPATSVFGNPAPAPAPAPSAFGNPAPVASAFGAPSTFGTSAFGGGGGGVAPAFNALAQGPTAFGSASVSTVPSPFAAAGAGGSSSSVFPMQQSTSQPPLSAFPMASPSTSVSLSASHSNSNSHQNSNSNLNSHTSASATNPKTSTTPDFAHAASLYQPGLTPYDQLLPADYIQRIPETARRAFESVKFEWGDVPEWTPPVEVR